MSILNDKDLYDLKWNYNYNLKRYNNGCNYLEKHRNEIDKWIPELMNILENINLLLEEIEKNIDVNDKEILEGFEL